MSINDIYTILMDSEYEFSRNIVILMVLIFIIIVIIDVLKWRYYGKK